MSTAMYPILFNVSSEYHGDKSMGRLIEEFNGPACFGSSFLRVLAGSGYGLYWSRSIFAKEIVAATDKQIRNKFAAKEPWHPCGCLHVDHLNKPTDSHMDERNSHGNGEVRQRENIALEFADRINKYFYRVIQLRSGGLADLYSR